MLFTVIQHFCSDMFLILLLQLSLILILYNNFHHFSVIMVKNQGMIHHAKNTEHLKAVSAVKNNNLRQNKLLAGILRNILKMFKD
jgi:hypothetical protein